MIKDLQEGIKVSLIIPTHNRREELKKLLISLGRQIFQKENFEIIVVDDGSTDGTESLMKEITSQFEGNLNYVFIPKQANSAAVRNIGAQKAGGEILIFIDSDCITHSGWLRNIVKMFDNQKIGCVGGSELAYPVESLFGKCCSFSVTSPFTTGGIRGKRGVKLGKYYPRSFNMAIPVKVFRELNGFNENFKHSHDIEIGCRIKEQGYDLVYAPDAIVYHRRPDTITNNFKQLFRMASFRIAVSIVHKVVLEPIYFLPSTVLIAGLILSIGSFFSETSVSLTKWFYLGILSYLLLIGFIAAFKLKDLRAFFLAPFLFVIHQTAYATGFLYGFLKYVILKKKY